MLLFVSLSLCVLDFSGFYSLLTGLFLEMFSLESDSVKLFDELLSLLILFFCFFWLTLTASYASIEEEESDRFF